MSVNFSALLIKKAYKSSYYNDEHSEGRGVFDPKSSDYLYPVNPVTGLPDTELSKLLNPLVSESEKADILNRLHSVKGSYLPKDMSDEDILTLVPPRYLTNDALDVDAWRSYIGRLVEDDEQLSKLENSLLGSDDKDDTSTSDTSTSDTGTSN